MYGSFMTRPAAENRIDEFLDSPRRAVWRLAVPMMAGFAAHSVYLAADMAFIGCLGPSALAGAQFVSALFFTVVALNIGFSTGVTAVIARAVGRRDAEGAALSASNAMRFGLIAGVVAAVICFFGGPYIIPLLGAEGDSLTLGIQYFEVLTVGMAVMFFSGAVRAVLTGEGDAATPMTIVLISAGLNIVLDPIFIFVLDFGIRGAAAATVAAQLFSLAAFCYAAFFRRKSYITFKWSIGRAFPHSTFIFSILKIGLPAAFGQLIISFGTIFYNRVIAAFGETAVAGYGAASKVDRLVLLPIMALAAAELSAVGIFAGAKRWDLVRSSILFVFKLALGITLFLCAVAYFWSFKIVGVFTDDIHASAVGHVYLRYMVLAYPLAAVGILSGRILQGLGRGLPPLVITTTRVLLIGVPCSYIAVYLFGASLETVWRAMITGGIVSAAAGVFWVRHVAWKHPSCLPMPDIPSPEVPLEEEGG